MVTGFVLGCCSAWVLPAVFAALMLWHRERWILRSNRTALEMDKRRREGGSK